MNYNRKIKQTDNASHTHSNKSILDSIQEALTTILKSAYDTCVTHDHIHLNKSILDNTPKIIYNDILECFIITKEV